MLVLHSVFPVLAVLLIAVLVASVMAILLGVPPLAPIPTPEGDLSGAVRFAWTVDGVVLVALAGATLPLVAHAHTWCAAACALLIAVCATRWRRRRTAS